LAVSCARRAGMRTVGSPRHAGADLPRRTLSRAVAAPGGAWRSPRRCSRPGPAVKGALARSDARSIAQYFDAIILMDEGAEEAADWLAEIPDPGRSAVIQLGRDLAGVMDE
jgi:hypothetical protein